ncbi:MAG: ATP-binding protein [Candidatus Diapherotrites archaeon]|uniref:ATP-binding protein n=1 Tax=Candidatus Iainarchaeum sp. TaxID=3101447 RepID=A0A8T4LKL9_9ARCH|nr:ATP-binding protein [Candidatus Diapherotrites archaeon]
MFYNRVKELQLLETLWSAKKPVLAVVYGRRRIGKTELLREFTKNHPAVYLLGRQESEHKQLEHISRACAEFFNDEQLNSRPFGNFDSVFSYFAEKLKQKPFAVFLDEFPYFVQANPSLPSILQDHWDKALQHMPCLFVLCGSSVSMMEKLLGYKSPLYGRRTHQMKLDPLDFSEARHFFPKTMDIKKQISYYAVLGGTPAYLLEFDYTKTLVSNIGEKILEKQSFLFRDPMFVLREELDEPRNYFSIVAAIAKGNTGIGRIVNDTGLEKGTVNKYLGVLIDLDLVERAVPITERKEKSRKGIYKLKDPFFRFWFRFVFENMDYVEQRKQKNLLNEKIEPELNAFIGKGFEEVCRDRLSKNAAFKDYLIGSWWDKGEEIDIVGLSKAKKSALFCECKWKEKVDAESLLRKLKQKAEKVSWFKEHRTERYCLFAKSFKEKKIDEKNADLYDLKDLEETFG